jgi:S1-C subfamily serine protease
MSALDELQAAIGAAEQRVGPAVVGIGRRRAAGSGVVIASGKVLTNAHTLPHDEVTVVFGDGREAVGQVSGSDVDGDVAVVSVDTVNVTPIDWSPVAPAVGTPVFALANPGGRGLRVTFGLVSSVGRSFRGPRGRRIADSIEHTAPLPRGSSGGPLVDTEGRLLGLNTLRLDGGLILALATGEAFRERADALARGEGPARSTLGILIAPPRAARRMRRAVGLPELDGILVRRTFEGSPAEAAGIERGDLIAAAAGAPITEVDDLYRALDATPDRLPLTVVRGTEEREVVVELGGSAPARA